MPFERLISKGKIKPYPSRPIEIKHLIEVAERDLTAANHNLQDNPDWAYSMAYNAVLQTSRALMLSKGYRPRGAEQHATVVSFVREMLGNSFTDQIDLFDQMRRKRHRILYEIAGSVSTSEAEQALSFAIEFVKTIKNILFSLPGM